MMRKYSRKNIKAAINIIYKHLEPILTRPCQVYSERHRGRIQDWAQRQVLPSKSSPLNMPSADEHPEVVDNYIREEVASERLVEMAGSEAERLGIHTSPFGVIPKKNKPNKGRLILDLSSPTGQSVNNGIGKELASLSYVSVDDVVNRVQQLGKVAMMAKMDAKQAY